MVPRRSISMVLSIAVVVVIPHLLLAWTFFFVHITAIVFIIITVIPRFVSLCEHRAAVGWVSFLGSSRGPCTCPNG